MKFIYKYQIHFDDCDPAGILFFANTWDICHRVYENWLLKLKNDYAFWFQNPEWIIPIITSKCNFHRPLKPGTLIDVELSVQNIGNSSFTTHYLLKKDSEIAMDCSISHVFTDKATFKKTSIPEELLPLFQEYLENP